MLRGRTAGGISSWTTLSLRARPAIRRYRRPGLHEPCGPGRESPGLRNIVEVRQFRGERFRGRRDLMSSGPSHRGRVPAGSRGLVPEAESASSRCGRAEDPIFAGFKHGGVFTLLRRRADLSLRPGGALAARVRRGTHYLKGLDASVHAIDRVREGRTWSSRAATLRWRGRRARRPGSRSIGDCDLISDLDAGRVLHVEPPAEQGAAARNERAARVSGADQRAGIRRLVCPSRAVPERLRPDAISAAGMPERRGRASDLRQCEQRGFRARAHVRRVRELGDELERAQSRSGRDLGVRLLQSRSVFLAGSDVLCQPVDLIAAYLDADRAGRFRSSPRHARSRPIASRAMHSAF